MMRTSPATALVPIRTMLCLCLLGAIGIAVPASGQNGAAAAAGAALAVNLDRGRALYGASCDSCHTQNIHWRDKRLVSSWTTLVNEVKRWQSNTGQGWKEAEINDVSAYLNDRFYGLPCPPDACLEKQAGLNSPPPR